MSVLIESSVRAILIAIAVAAIVRGCRVRDARALHGAALAVVLAMILLPAWAMWGPQASIPVFKGAPAMASPFELWTPPVQVMPSSPPRVDAPPSAAALPPTAPIDWLFLSWISVAGALFLRLVHGAIRLSSIRRRAGREDGFLVSRECSCPITAGWWNPDVVLPSTWSEWPPAELAAVLAHERAHVRRRDPLVQSLAAVNRCVFWFHPLAWWLERRLVALAEEACDAAAIASGHDPHDYSECLIRQARAVRSAGGRIAIRGTAMAGGNLERRIRMVLDAGRAPASNRSGAALAAALSFAAIAVFGACRLAEKPAAGQPTMHELAERRWASSKEYQEREHRLNARARSLTPSGAQDLFEKVKQDPADQDSVVVLVRYYQGTSDVKGLDALKLWLIANRPAGQHWVNIDPRQDREGYEKGKALWLAHVKKPGAQPEVFRRAADFLEGADKPLAESVLEAGRAAYPSESWASAFGRHYAQVLIGSGEPVTDFNVLRAASTAEASTAYAQKVRAQLAASTDPQLLAQTAQSLVFNYYSLAARFARVASSMGGGRPGGARDVEALASAYAERALQLDPGNELAQSTRYRVAEAARYRRLNELRTMPAEQLAAAPAADRLFLAMFQMREETYRQGYDAAASKAKELLALAGQNATDPSYGEIVYSANIVIGKAALKRGDRRTAARHLLAAADAPASDYVRRGSFDMNLPRALVDWGERRAVVDFLRRIAPKTGRAKQLQDWAADIEKGLNPDLIPTFSAPGCTNDPC